MDDILMKIGEYGIVVTILVAIIKYFLIRENKSEAQINALHTELRETEKENLTALYKVTALMDKIVDNDTTRNDALMSEIKAMRDSIEFRIDNLK